jgi:hypothetical protein
MVFKLNVFEIGLLLAINILGAAAIVNDLSNILVDK